MLWKYLNLFLYSPFEGHLDYFQYCAVNLLSVSLRLRLRVSLEFTSGFLNGICYWHLRLNNLLLRRGGGTEWTAYRMLGSIPGHYPLDASNICLLPSQNQKYFQSRQMFPGGTGWGAPPINNHWSIWPGGNC